MAILCVIVYETGVIADAENYFMCFECDYG